MLKILTVDDSAIVAERLREMFNEMPDVVYRGNATNIAGALHLVKKEMPHVIILDIHLESEMPTANGINLLVSLRKLYADLKIVMLTNLAEDQYRNTCLFLGADYFLDKSNEFEKIPHIIQELNKSKVA